MIECKEKHMCYCGMASTTPHRISEDGCERYMTESPVPAPDDPKLGKSWYVDGYVINDYILTQQRGYHQHECGCWSRWEGSINSLEWD